MFVVGGSYKGFYINELKKINKIDLLVFHQNIFYDFDYEQEYLGYAPVTKELISLNKILKCPIVIYGVSKFLEKKQRCFILCINEKVSVVDSIKDIYLYIKGKVVLIGNKLYKNSKAFSTISIFDKKQNFQNISKNMSNNCFICDKKGVSLIRYGGIYRKFRKCCYFSLCFNKKYDTIT